MAALVLPLLTGAQSSSSQMPVPRGTGSITGKVIEAGSRDPVGDAVVNLTAPDDAAWRFTGGLTVITDNAGQFVFRDLPRGVYRLRAQADGFVPSLFGQERPVQIERAQDASLVRTLDLADGESLAGMTISMWRKAGVGGFVGDDVGEPVVGVRVSVIARVVDWTGVKMRVAATVATDDRGLYHADVTPGDYVVGVLAATTTATAGWIAGADRWATV